MCVFKLIAEENVLIFYGHKWSYLIWHTVIYLCRPNDSRMLVALGESYEKLSQQVEAKKV